MGKNIINILKWIKILKKNILLEMSPTHGPYRVVLHPNFGNISQPRGGGGLYTFVRMPPILTMSPHLWTLNLGPRPPAPLFWKCPLHVVGSLTLFQGPPHFENVLHLWGPFTLSLGPPYWNCPPHVWSFTLVLRPPQFEIFLHPWGP
jgi:hypothetical protein